MPFRRMLQRGVTRRTEGLSCLQEAVVYDPFHKQEVGMKDAVKAHHVPRQKVAVKADDVPLVYLSMRVVQAGE